jgi:hypothetical protein
MLLGFSARLGRVLRVAPRVAREIAARLDGVSGQIHLAQEGDEARVVTQWREEE